MDDPVQEIAGVISQLTQGSPAVQAAAIDKYFTPDAAFTHPFCRTGGWNGSRGVIHAIYRWYKIMSPQIGLEIHSIGEWTDNPKPLRITCS